MTKAKREKRRVAYLVVTAQRNRKGRWAYVIDDHRPMPVWPFVSYHRYGSEEAALDAGVADAQACVVYEREGLDP